MTEKATMNPDRTLGELVTAIPAAAKVFHRHGLDFCCGGKRSLAQACAADGLDAGAVLREIEGAAATAEEDVRWDERPLSELIQHILDRYHAPLKTEVARLIELAAKVERAHADKPDCPHGLTKLLSEVRVAIDSHLAKEEQILFPLFLAGRGAMAHMPVQVMVHEHDDHGDNLRSIRDLTRNMTLPADACATWRELYRALAELEMELMEHIHLENNVLFPRALAG
jgi:regulator of cell morphogenesis and NO signaling